MLNELYALSQAISGAGIEQSTNWHRQLKELPRGICFRVYLAADGSVADIEEMIDEKKEETDRKEKDSRKKKKGLRKYEPNNGVSFPCFNMPMLYTFPQEDKKEKTDRIKKWADGKETFDINSVKEWYEQGKIDWNSKVDDSKANSPLIGKKVGDCFAVMQDLADTRTAETNSILALVRLLKSVSFAIFRENLEKYIFGKLQQETDLKTLLSLLSFLFADKQPQIFLDLKDWQSLGYPVAHEKTMQWLNNVLNNDVLDNSDKKSLTNSKKPDSSQDAFGGVVDIQDKMGSVRLPGLGDVRLRSMFKDHGCQFRYEMIEDESFPIGRKQRDDTKAALEWLSKDELRGTTWLLADSKEIVFAYPATIPPIHPKWASLLGGSKDGNKSTGESQYKKEAKFANIAEDVIETLKGLPPDKQPKDITVFSIRKMDKARSKVVFYRNYTTDRLIEAAKKWQAGCENLPPMPFRIWADKIADTKSVPENVEPEIPFPLQIAGIANSVWKQDGSSAGKVPKFDYYQGIELLLENNYAATEQYLLQTLISHSFGLIRYLGNYLHGNDKNGYRNVLDRKRFNDVMYLPSLFGLLLYKQNIHKENYMETLPYLLGQMLKISDELHTMYCLVVRNGEVPPQLVGNSIMSSAFETPHQALAMLAQRMVPYIAWAKQYRWKNITNNNGKESWRAKWFIQLYERNADKVILDSAVRFNDLDKAQLFLGYLAAFPKRQDTNTQTISEQEGEENE